MTENLRRRDRCRMCDSPNLQLVLPIHASPIADAYVQASRLGHQQETYPLDLYLCLDCSHVQNLDVVNPEVLFRDYLFTTASSGGLVAHFQRYAADVVSQCQIQPGSLVVEIGSNDGSLLKFFKQQGMRVLGVDPARKIAAQATAAGVETLPEFFSSSIAARIRGDYGSASVFCANNVFAHADDLADIVRGIREGLAEDGVFVFEVSYLVDIVDKYLFDTVYHEHVSYHSIAPVARLFDRLGMQLFDVKRNASKGGSIRGFAQRRPEGTRRVESVVGEMIRFERQRGFDKPGVYREYAKRIDERKAALNHFLDQEIDKGKMIAGYGASTTTTTLLWHFELTRKLAFIVDDNPRKQGLYSPGCHIPITSADELYRKKPDHVVILAWQYAEPIVKKHQKFLGSGGRFVVPLPELRVIAGEQRHEHTG